MELSEKEKKILELIKHESYANYFFKKASDVKWFYPLKRKGFFNSDKMPEPIQVKDGYQIPFWQPLQYLEKISLQIKDGYHFEYIDELIKIIKDISEVKKDNHNTWYVFTKILNNLPNDKIPSEIFDYIPLWLNSRFETMLPSAEICEKLLPKFLNENPTEEDKIKAEKILEHIFVIKKIEREKSENQLPGFITRFNSYKPSIELYCLKEVLINKKLVELIAEFCSKDTIFILAENLKKMLRDYPDGIKGQIKHNGENHQIIIYIQEKDLYISFGKEITENENSANSYNILNFENLSNKTLLEKIINIVKTKASNIDNDAEAIKELQKMINTLTIDLSFVSCPTLEKLNDQFLHGDNPKDVFALIIRDLLNFKCKYHFEESAEILDELFEKEYRLPFFKRLVFYAISENWERYNYFFWKKVEKNDKEHFFSSYHYDKQLYALLKKNISKFTAEEKNTINNIIKIGPQDDREGREEDYKEYWQLKWLSAVKVDEMFTLQYNALSEKLNLTNEHYEEIGEIKFSSGSSSYYSSEDILKMSNAELVKKILEFKPKNRFEEPSIDGFGRILEETIRNHPEKFAEEIHLFHKVYYVYAFHLIYGFKDSWKEKREFNIKNVLNFCLDYCSQIKFGTDELKLDNESYGANEEWVTGAIGNLIREGTEDDNNAFEENIFPIVEKILLKIIPGLKVMDDIKESNMGYATYPFNSTAGKALMGLINFALRNARLQLKESKESDIKIKWQINIRNLYEDALKKRIIDAYILQGIYLRQFNFLDSNWNKKLIKEYYEIDDKYWSAFMGGYAFNHPVNNQEIYDLMYPHYARAIKKKIEFNDLNDYGITRHITLYYMWGYENLGDNNLITKFLNEIDAKQINNLLSYLWAHYDEIHHWNIKNKTTKERVFELWEYILKRFKGSHKEEDLKLISGLSRLIAFVEELDEKNVALIIESAKMIDYNYNSSFFIEELTKLKAKGKPLQTAKFITQIYKEILANSTPTYKQENIKSIVEFLYENKNDIDVKNIADEICNEYGKRGYDFLKEIYNRNKV